MSSATLPLPQANWCLFLDFDGTLVEIQEHPEAVSTPPRVTDLLVELERAFAGAVAIVSGRSLEGLDRLLGGMRLPAAGIHGLERRDAQGAVHRPVDHTATFQHARSAAETYAGAHAGLYLEDKGNALALHYRGAPELADDVHAFLDAQSHELEGEFHVQAGKAVAELKPTGHHKGTVVRAFMSEPPFVHRLPVFLGDDVTDEDAFKVVNAFGGHSILVGSERPTAARHRLSSVSEAIEWLASLPARVS